MSAFVCGYCFPATADAELNEPDLGCLEELARHNGLCFRFEEKDELPSVVIEILQQATQPAERWGTRFLLSTPELSDVSDAVINVHDDLVGTSISVREAVLARIAPLVDVVQTAFESGLVGGMIIVISYGLDVCYPEVRTTPGELAEVIAAAYEAACEVPSLKTIVQCAPRL